MVFIQGVLLAVAKHVLTKKCTICHTNRFELIAA